MKSFNSTLFGLFAAVFLLTACQKTPEYVQEPYKCECGSISWNGLSIDVLGAEYISPSGEFSRRYYTTTEIGGVMEEEEVHHIHFQMDIDDIAEVLYDIEETPLNMVLQEVDNNHAIVYKDYQINSGVVSLVPAVFGGEEQVNFNLIVRQVIDGTPFGPEIPFSGSFTVDVVL